MGSSGRRDSRGRPSWSRSNFDALYSYNAAESYALAIGHLSDRLKGKGGFKTAWPTDDPGLARAQRKRLQQALDRQGLLQWRGGRADRPANRRGDQIGGEGDGPEDHRPAGQPDPEKAHDRLT